MGKIEKIPNVLNKHSTTNWAILFLNPLLLQTERKRHFWLRDFDPTGDREGLSSSRLSCKLFSGSPQASSRPSSLHKPTNKATSWREPSQDSWPSILLHEPKRKEATFRGPASEELSHLLLLFLYSRQTDCGQPSQPSGRPGQLGKERPFQTPVSSPIILFFLHMRARIGRLQSHHHKWSLIEVVWN